MMACRGEDEYDDELIDAFDAPPPPPPNPTPPATRPFPSSSSVRYPSFEPRVEPSTSSYASELSQHKVPVIVGRQPPTSLYPIDLLAHYTSQDTGGISQTATIHERLPDTDQRGPEAKPSQSKTDQTEMVAPQIAAGSLPQPLDARTEPATPVDAQPLSEVDVLSPVMPVNQEMATMSDDELLAKRRAIEREMRGYQERMEYVAHALAGDTPHQLQARAQRETDRMEREEHRMQARELRVLHHIDRLHEREARQLARRMSRGTAQDDGTSGSESDSSI